MNRVEIETQLMQELRRLPLDKAEEILDFALFLRSRNQNGHPASSKQRPLGILKGKASCHIAEDFSISDEELNLSEEIKPGEHELVLMIDPETNPAPLRRQPGSAKGKLIILADDEEHMEFALSKRCGCRPE